MEYDLRKKQEQLNRLAAKVHCVLVERSKGKSFQKIADVCGISSRQEAFRMYKSNSQTVEIAKNK